MDARQNAYFAADRTNFIQGAPVRTYLLVRNHMAHDSLLDMVQDLGNFLHSIRVFLSEMGYGLFLDGRNICITGKFIAVSCCSVETGFCIGAHFFFQFFGYFEYRRNLFLFPTGLLYVLLELDQSPDLCMSKKDSIQNDFFRQLICSGFYHHDSIV